MELKDLKIGITLSGGGVRASVFHLGVLSRLADENLLEQVKMTSTVSGGSLVTGMVYQSNNNKWPTSAEFKSKSVSYVKTCLTKRNLQLNAMLRMLFWPVSLFTVGRAGVVAKSMESCWGIKSKLNDIDAWPRWNINGTAIESGKSWRFIPKNRMGDYVLQYVDTPDIKLADALCSSAAVPILIGPYTLKTKKYKWYQYDDDKKSKIEYEPVFKKIHIWDGGAYDNLGVEPLVKFDGGLEYRKEINFLIVSDAAMALDTEKRKWYNPMRLIDVTMDQVRSLRARALWDHFLSNENTGTYMQIGESTTKITKDHHYKGTTQLSTYNFSDGRIDELKNYPTTLWKMKDKDFDDLYKHGWEVANAALVCQSPGLFHNQIL